MRKTAKKRQGVIIWHHSKQGTILLKTYPWKSSNYVCIKFDLSKNLVSFNDPWKILEPQMPHLIHQTDLSVGVFSKWVEVFYAKTGFAILTWNNPKQLEKPCITKKNNLM